MIFSYNWLREYIELPDPDALARILTFGGIEVETHYPYAQKLRDITIAKILAVEKHPDADKLSVCQVDTGNGIKQVVCGAPNCRENMLTPYAPVGVKLGNTVINKVNIRGIDSEGMLCSERDIDISDDHSGLMSLPDNAVIGKDLRSYLSLNDTIYEVEVTPNRPDLLGMLGIARDVAALTKQQLILPAGFPTDGYSYPNASLRLDSSKEFSFALSNEAPELCSRYLARVITGVRIMESPRWLKDKLLAAAIKPINNLVDITNYVMLEFGHPLHAFDYKLLKGDQIRIRKADKGEKISALDQRVYQLEENDLVIADKDNPVALAGIVGGTDSSITNSTETIVLEAANFNYLSIRRTAARLKINTDSSYRFERNLSDETVSLISQRATALICEICGGELLYTVDSYPQPEEKRTLELRITRANRLLTTDFSAKDVTEMLESLGLRKTTTESESLRFEIPPYRKDLSREIDLIEELIRLYGYNNIPQKSEKESLTAWNWFHTKRYLADYLIFNGFSEAVNSSFTEPAIIKQLKLPVDDQRNHYFELNNPLGASFSMMRTTLIPGLLKNVQFNLHNGQTEIKLFELGKVYLKKDKEPEERYYLTGVVSGDISQDHWRYKTRETSIFSVKGYVEGLLAQLTDDEQHFRSADISYCQSGSGMEIVMNKIPVGTVGKLDPLLASSIDIEEAVYVFDIDITLLRKTAQHKTVSYREVNKYPPVTRDLSFVISKDFQHQEIEKTIRETNRELIGNIRLKDEFMGKNIPQGSRSLTYSILFSSREGTLTDERVNLLMDTIITKLKKDYEIEMR
jgi:phenylalanyl-tRNA synthetase beta chain